MMRFLVVLVFVALAAAQQGCVSSYGGICNTTLPCCPGTNNLQCLPHNGAVSCQGSQPLVFRCVIASGFWPVDNKLGACPSNSTGYGYRCGIDLDCPTNQKCCSSECATPVGFPCLALDPYQNPQAGQIFATCNDSGEDDRETPAQYEAIGSIFRACANPPTSIGCF